MKESPFNVREIENANKQVESLVKECLNNNNPTLLSDNIIKLTTWKFWIGQKVADSAKLLQEAENQMEFEYATSFLEAKLQIKVIGIKEKPFSEDEARSQAETNTKIARDAYAQILWYKTRIFNFWKDLETMIDAIKYKINALINERKYTAS